ncbi:unnamed protein product, partial [Amoebophrya sp. A120]
KIPLPELRLFPGVIPQRASDLFISPSRENKDKLPAESCLR